MAEFEFAECVLERASVDDVDEIIEVLMRANDAMHAKGQPKAWTRVPEGGVLADAATGKSIVIRHAGAVVGTASLHEDDSEIWGDQPSDALYLHRLAVDPSFQSQGLGSAIIHWAEDKVIEGGRTYLRLDAVAEHEIMRAGYEKRGFEPCGLVKPPSYKRPAMRYQKLVTPTVDNSVDGGQLAS